MTENTLIRLTWYISQSKYTTVTLISTHLNGNLGCKIWRAGRSLDIFQTKNSYCPNVSIFKNLHNIANSICLENLNCLNKAFQDHWIALMHFICFVWQFMDETINQPNNCLYLNICLWCICIKINMTGFQVKRESLWIAMCRGMTKNKL